LRALYSPSSFMGIQNPMTKLHNISILMQPYSPQNLKNTWHTIPLHSHFFSTTNKFRMSDQ